MDLFNARSSLKGHALQLAGPILNFFHLYITDLPNDVEFSDPHLILRLGAWEGRATKDQNFQKSGECLVWMFDESQLKLELSPYELDHGILEIELWAGTRLIGKTEISMDEFLWQFDKISSITSDLGLNDTLFEDSITINKDLSRTIDLQEEEKEARLAKYYPLLHQMLREVRITYSEDFKINRNLKIRLTLELRTRVIRTKKHGISSDISDMMIIPHIPKPLAIITEIECCIAKKQIIMRKVAGIYPNDRVYNCMIEKSKAKDTTTSQMTSISTNTTTTPTIATPSSPTLTSVVYGIFRIAKSDKVIISNIVTIKVSVEACGGDGSKLFLRAQRKTRPSNVIKFMDLSQCIENNHHHANQNHRDNGSNDNELQQQQQQQPTTSTLLLESAEVDSRTFRSYVFDVANIMDGCVLTVGLECPQGVSACVRTLKLQFITEKLPEPPGLYLLATELRHRQRFLQVARRRKLLSYASLACVCHLASRRTHRGQITYSCDRETSLLDQLDQFHRENIPIIAQKFGIKHRDEYIQRVRQRICSQCKRNADASSADFFFCLRTDCSLREIYIFRHNSYPRTLTEGFKRVDVSFNIDASARIYETERWRLRAALLERGIASEQDSISTNEKKDENITTKVISLSSSLKCISCQQDKDIDSLLKGSDQEQCTRCATSLAPKVLWKDKQWKQRLAEKDEVIEHKRKVLKEYVMKKLKDAPKTLPLRPLSASLTKGITSTSTQSPDINSIWKTSRGNISSSTKKKMNKDGVVEEFDADRDGDVKLLSPGMKGLSGNKSSNNVKFASKLNDYNYEGEHQHEGEHSGKLVHSKSSKSVLKQHHNHSITATTTPISYSMSSPLLKERKEMGVEMPYQSEYNDSNGRSQKQKQKRGSLLKPFDMPAAVTMIASWDVCRSNSSLLFKRDVVSGCFPRVERISETETTPVAVGVVLDPISCISIKLVECPYKGGVLSIGVCTTSFPLEGSPGFGMTTASWGLSELRINDSVGTNIARGGYRMIGFRSFQAGDVISIVINLNVHTARITVNDNELIHYFFLPKVHPKDIFMGVTLPIDTSIIILQKQMLLDDPKLLHAQDADGEDVFDTSYFGTGNGTTTRLHREIRLSREMFAQEYAMWDGTEEVNDNIPNDIQSMTSEHSLGKFGSDLSSVDSLNPSARGSRLGSYFSDLDDINYNESECTILLPLQQPATTSLPSTPSSTLSTPAIWTAGVSGNVPINALRIGSKYNDRSKAMEPLYCCRLERAGVWCFGVCMSGPLEPLYIAYRGKVIIETTFCEYLTSMGSSRFEWISPDIEDGKKRLPDRASAIHTDDDNSHIFIGRILYGGVLNLVIYRKCHSEAALDIDFGCAIGEDTAYIKSPTRAAEQGFKNNDYPKGGFFVSRLFTHIHKAKLSRANY
eukprot:gene7476-15302_t